jgi:hypothetical protein
LPRFKQDNNFKNSVLKGERRLRRPQNFPKNVFLTKQKNALTYMLITGILLPMKQEQTISKNCPETAKPGAVLPLPYKFAHFFSKPPV